jgi:hypothetical protein
LSAANKVPQLVQRATSKRQDGSRALIPGGRLSFESVKPAPELVTVKIREANRAMAQPTLWRSLQEPGQASAADKPTLS